MPPLCPNSTETVFSMKYGRQTPNPPHDRAADAGDGRRAGFTLIEVVIAIVILGILSAAVAVNWSSFIRYQELRQDAYGFHKELMALKAKALENDDTIKVGWSKPDSGCTIVKGVFNEDGDKDGTTSTRVNLNKKVKVGFPTDNSINNKDGDLIGLGLNGNKWENDSINVWPDNLKPYNYGRLIIVNGSNKFFCIQADSTSIKPELYSRSGNGPWKRI